MKYINIRLEVVRPAIERFLEKISVSETKFYKGIPCWEWIASKNNNGYGIFGVDGKTILTHRFIYEYYNGEINPKLEVHHRCYIRSCCNITHLDERTHKENTLDIDSSAPSAINTRKTHCKHGHEFTSDNTYHQKNGRHCKTCANTFARKWNKTHKNEIKEYHQIYYRENGEKNQIYLENNRDKIKERQRRYRKENKNKINEKRREHYALKKDYLVIKSLLN